jgi:serine/threonine protein kinase
VYTTEPREITESFRLERVLKSSRSAIVFRAVEPNTGAMVAIKLIPPTSPIGLEACRERFLAAMGVLASAGPEPFPTLLDYGFCPDGSAFMVMELVEGDRLDSLAGTPPGRVLALILEVIDGLEALQQGGVSHGNIAPENLLALSQGYTEHIKILGFGTAAFHSGFATAGAVVLTEGPAQFAAPEQLDPTIAPVADWRSDLYALAATTCYLLQAEVAAADAPAPDVSLPPHVRTSLQDPPALQKVLAQALRRDPAARPASFDEFRQAIQRALAEAPAEPVADELVTPTPSISVGTSLPPEPPAGEPLAGGAAGGQFAVPEKGEDTSPARITPIFPKQSEEEPRPESVSAEPDQVTPELLTSGRETTGAALATIPADMPTAPSKAETEPPVPLHPEPLPTPAPAGEPLPAPKQHPEAAATPPARALAPIPEGDHAAQHGQPLVPQPVTEPPAQAPAAPAKPAAKPSRKRRIAPLAIGIAAVVVLGSVTGWFWIGSQQPERLAPHAAPTAAPRKPSPSPQPVQVNAAAVQLEKAEAAVALGELAAAGAAFDAISPEDLGGLSQPEQERYKTIRATYGTMRRQALTKAMQRALAAGNIKVLTDTVREISNEEEAVFKRDADFSASIEEAHRALNLQATLLKAQRQGDLAQVLQNSSVLVEVVPKYALAAEAREKAAAALEREADTLAAKGSFDLALARLDTVRRSWPTRTGLQDRLERVKTEQETDQRFTALMAQVQQTEAGKAPEKGLELLKSLPPNAQTAERVQQMRERLTKQLEQLDAQPPTLALAPGLKLEYKKGEAVILAFKIQDDHGVKDAQLFARVEGSGKYVELPLRRGTGADWSAEISASFHQNQTVDFYVAASDYSGHTAQLGKAQEPLKLKRKKNIFGF